MKSSAAIVLLNYNSYEYLRMFLPTLIANSPDWATIYIIDNASSDHSKSFVTQEFPQIQWIQLDDNYGFAGGYQKGLQQIDEPFWVIMNTDVEVTKNWLPPLIEHLEADKQLAAIQPKIKSYHNKSYFEHAGASGGFIDRFGYPFCRGRLFDTVEEDNGQYDNFTYCFWASGACFALRNEAYFKAGEFDPRFFMHMEEIDLCWRLQGVGYKIACEPKSTVYHVGGGTLSYENPRKTYFNFRNSKWLLLKNMPNSFAKIVILIIRFHLDCIAFWKDIFSLRFTHAVEILKSFYSPKSIWFPRNVTKIDSKLLQGYQKRSIVIDYFVSGKKTFNSLQQ